MRKIIWMVVLFIFLSILMPVSFAETGFGPAEIFCENQASTMVLGTASLINGDNVPKYGIFSLIMPYSHGETWQVVSSEIIHARVVCNKCSEEMQRWEAIPGYKHGDPLEGVCERCGSTDLLFYDVMPRDEFYLLSVEGAENFELIRNEDSFTWRTDKQISPGGCCNVNVIYDSSESYIQENFGKHWEFHLRGSTQVEKNLSGGFVIGGLDLRVLLSFKFPLYIEIIGDVEKGEEFTIRVTYGDAGGSWNTQPAGNTWVTFNGERRQTDKSGYATFIYPDSRGDYEYKITAENDDDSYSKTSLVIGTKKPSVTEGFGNDANDESFISLSNPLFIAVVCVCIIIVAGVIIKWRRSGKKKKKEKEDSAW